MRFQFLGPRKDVASAEQVRAVRDARGWTAEQMADAVAASPLEVQAWESGAVSVPPLQATRVQWLLATDRRNAAAAEMGIEPCDWMRRHVLDVYEIVPTDATGLTWYSRSQEIRDHFAGCSTCKAMSQAMERLGPPPPPPPDAASFDTLHARYQRWVQRCPRWLRAPLTWLRELSGLAILGVLVLTFPRADSGLPARITGLGMGTLFGTIGFRMAGQLLHPRFPRHRFATGLLAGAAASVTMMVSWRLYDSSAPLGDPRLWAGAAVLSVAAGLWTRRGEGPAKASAALPAQPGLAPPSAAPHLLPGTRISATDDVPPLRAGSVLDGVRPR